MYVRYVIMRCKEEGRNLEEEIKFIQDKDEMDAIHLADLHAENKALKEGKLK